MLALALVKELEITGEAACKISHWSTATYKLLDLIERLDSLLTRLE